MESFKEHRNPNKEYGDLFMWQFWRGKQIISPFIPLKANTRNEWFCCFYVLQVALCVFYLKDNLINSIPCFPTRKSSHVGAGREPGSERGMGGAVPNQT